jgi:hypothetical protein
VLHEFVHDEVLSAPLLRQAVGDEWLRRTRAGVLARHNMETELAMLAAAPVVLERALSALRGS